jgi:hypothetical protein
MVEQPTRFNIAYRCLRMDECACSTCEVIMRGFILLARSRPRFLTHRPLLRAVEQGESILCIVCHLPRLLLDCIGLYHPPVVGTANRWSCRQPHCWRFVDRNHSCRWKHPPLSSHSGVHHREPVLWQVDTPWVLLQYYIAMQQHRFVSYQIQCQYDLTKMAMIRLFSCSKLWVVGQGRTQSGSRSIS